MKLYSISKILFWTVLVLIILLPLGRHWRLLSFGERTTGTAMEYTRFKKLNMYGEAQLIEATEVHFTVGDSLVKTRGPVDYAIEPGTSIRVYYNPNDPSDNLLFSFAAIYMSNYSILPLVLIIVWYAFYLSFNNYHRDKYGESRTPASSPYVPFGKRAKNKNKEGNKPREIG